jgi:heme A synthase
MSILLAAHSGVRWLVILVAVVVFVKFIWGWLGQKPYTALDRTLAKVFAGVVDLQVLLGIIYLLWSGFAGAGFPRYRLEHGVTMILVAVAAHFASRGKGSSDSVRFRNATLAILVTFLLIYAGIAVLPGGWSR